MFATFGKLFKLILNFIFCWSHIESTIKTHFCKTYVYEISIDIIFKRLKGFQANNFKDVNNNK